jgi:hypothetical protein
MRFAIEIDDEWLDVLNSLTDIVLSGPTATPEKALETAILFQLRRQRVEMQEGNMGYTVSIAEMDLRSSRDIRQELAREDLWFLGYYQEEEGRIEVADRCFRWDEAFITDLLTLRELGVRGYVITVDQDDDWTKYVLKDEGVEEYSGQVVFSENPENVYLNEEPLITH